ncbi:MAG: restriction endonuclease subunit S, partial [Synergistaceae bacterium]|nr:restriction endonuclease subunit S [Synergistaceae bacterium]
MIAEQLKKSILQAAIQGKLTQQLPEDGDARDLLKDIQKEKARLIKEGKIKKEKPLPEITEDEIPFEIPENWCWCRLRELGITQTGNTPSKTHIEYYGDFIPFVTPGEILNGVINYPNKGLSEKGKNAGRVSGKKSILQVCIGGSIGKCAVNTKETAYNQQINAITPILADYFYVFYFMNSHIFISQMKNKSTGTATPIINKSTWESLVVSVPPIKEQKRIVNSVNQFFYEIDQLKNDETKLEELQKSFPKKMKDAILQYAIHGKLTQQLPEDGDARDLLKEIQKEKARLIKEGKIKKEKPLPEITE